MKMETSKLFFDTNGNGNPDEAEVDKNEDGIAEYIAYDLDEDDMGQIRKNIMLF